MNELDLLRDLGHDIDRLQEPAPRRARARLLAGITGEAGPAAPGAAAWPGAASPAPRRSRRPRLLAPNLATVITAAVVIAAVAFGAVALRSTVADQQTPSAADGQPTAGAVEPPQAAGDDSAAVRQILADVPVPASVDVEAVVRSADDPDDPYQLTAHVTAAVACGWFDQYVAATGSGDVTAADEALDALATAREWDALTAMASEGRFPAVLWQYADALVNDGTVPTGRDEISPIDELGGGGLDGDMRAYEAALGCGE